MEVLTPPSPQIKTKHDLSSASKLGAFTILIKGISHAGQCSRELGLGLDLHPPCPFLFLASLLMLPQKGSLKQVRPYPLLLKTLWWLPSLRGPPISPPTTPHNLKISHLWILPSISIKTCLINNLKTCSCLLLPRLFFFSLQ